jgi:hypothetical protein
MLLGDTGADGAGRPVTAADLPGQFD